MSNLEELDLSDNHLDNIKGNGEGFTGCILFFQSLSKLKMLNLRWNELKGLVTSNGLDELKHLQELYLDYSSIDKIFLHNVGHHFFYSIGWCELSNL
ncbi:hypothetical protein CsSME_00023258 [Camellia sinensis var. sinensis]